MKREYKPVIERKITEELTKDAYSVKEASELLGLSKGTVRRMIHLGEMKGEMVGSYFVIRKAELQQFVS